MPQYNSFNRKMETKTCQSCAAIIRGRSDKKFCNDSCRNAYNNQCRSNNAGAVKEINKILFKNRSVLESFHRPGTTRRVRKDLLLSKGLLPGFHTHQKKTRSGKQFYFCYEYGYCVISSEIILVSKQHNSSATVKLV
jgi:hypothetical protein